MTHDHKRNGTATLFAAMNTLDGTIISMCDDRHRHQEWLKSPRVIDEVTLSGQQIHLIADNYATHKHAKVQPWLARHRRFVILLRTGLRRGIFRDVEELIIGKRPTNPSRRACSELRE